MTKVASDVAGIKMGFWVNGTEYPFDKDKIISIAHTIHKGKLQMD